MNVLASNPDEFLPTRQTLLSRLRNWNDQDSWREFFETYWKLIYNAAMKSGLTEAEAQDVVQETVLSVSKAMPGFHYDPAKGSFKKWLMNLTSWRIKDQFRKRLPIAAPVETGTSTETASLDHIPDSKPLELDRLWDQEWETNLLEAALNRVKRQIDPKQYQLFDLYSVKGLSVSEIKKILQVSAGRIYLAKHRVTILLRRELKHLKAELE